MRPQHIVSTCPRGWILCGIRGPRGTDLGITPESSEHPSGGLRCIVAGPEMKPQHTASSCCRVLLTSLCLIFPGAELGHCLWYTLTNHTGSDITTELSKHSAGGLRCIRLNLKRRLSTQPAAAAEAPLRAFRVLLTALCLIFPGAEWGHSLWYRLTYSYIQICDS